MSAAAGPVVAYAICRHCAAVFPAERRCPQCDHDLAAAAAIAAATAYAVEPSQRRIRETAPARPRLLLPLVGVAALMLGLGIGLAWLVVDETPSQLTMSVTDEADR